MKTSDRMLIAAFLFTTAAGLATSARAADQVPVDPMMKVEPIGPPKPADSGPTVTGSAGCPNGKCAEAKGGAAKGKARSTFYAVWQYVCYTPARGPCGCKPPTLYRPPLYTWFNCNMWGASGSCGTLPRPSGQPLVKAKHFDEPLPMPAMPKIVIKERPLVPGSSTALAEQTETSPIQPVNYKSLPVVPDSGRR